jgi:hypothetical protein
MAAHDDSERRYETLQHCHDCRFESSSEKSLECDVELVRGRRHRVKMVTESWEEVGMSQINS